MAVFLYIASLIVGGGVGPPFQFDAAANSQNIPLGL